MGRKSDVILLAWLGSALVCGTASADQAMAKQTKKACTVCHTTMNTKERNDAGKYSKEKKTLDEYQPKPGAQK
ncbi:MAG: hypothetical protein A3H28_08135 [Acidobacteria bacterium RIFCSPLOWO2_02_FULL_61_28]|nr:MAG: hypothetical protein A3H28_08135 [Acidobacteria bacterium RIFCSPLOWO2_02_FULL_61_28]